MTRSQLHGYVPYSLRIETLRENGMPTIVVDNRSVIWNALFPDEPAELRACSTSVSRRSSGAPYLALCGLAIMALLFRRRV